MRFRVEHIELIGSNIVETRCAGIVAHNVFNHIISVIDLNVVDRLRRIVVHIVGTDGGEGY